MSHKTSSFTLENAAVLWLLFWSLQQCDGVLCCVCRERTKLVYSMYSRMSGETVKRNLMKLGVDYFVLEDSWCTRRTR